MEKLRVDAIRDLGLDLQTPEPSLDFICKMCSDVFQVRKKNTASQQLSPLAMIV